MFDGFTDERVDVGEAELRVRHRGTGRPAVLLLHGHPRTSATWHRVAPRLLEAGLLGGLSRPARLRRVVATRDDAPITPPYSKRAMAGDMVALMRHLGHDRFVVVGHDRGSYVAFRLAMDHPDVVAGLAVLDGVPIAEALARCTDRFATAWWHWFFFAQPEKPERAINADPDAWYGGTPTRWATRPTTSTGGRSTTRRRCTRCWRTTAPGWASTGPTTRPTALQDVACRAPCSCCGRPGTISRISTATRCEVWAGWADDLRGQAVDSGHHMAEEAPAELARAIDGFVRGLG